MPRDGAVPGMVLRIFLRVTAQSLQAHRAALHFSALAFIHRFDSSLNGHVHFHVRALDGVFEEEVGTIGLPESGDSQVSGITAVLTATDRS